MDVSASALRTFRFDQDCARSPRCSHRGSRGFEASNPGPIWLGPELLIEASLLGSACRFLFCTAGLWMGLAACDNVPRYPTTCHDIRQRGTISRISFRVSPRVVRLWHSRF